MKYAVVLIFVVFVIGMGWRMFTILQADAIGLATGVLFGVLFGLPVTMLILVGGRK